MAVRSASESRRYTAGMFLDEAVVEFVSGRGGDGAATFHREKHVPRGGPNGADGGRGGSVELIADRSKRTLYDFKLKRRFEARDGHSAQGNKRGSDAPNVEIRVPIGTVVYDLETGLALADLDHEQARFVVCRGGRGGKGNVHFVSSVRQAPRMAEKGEPGETVHARLELKLLADIGLIGLPNAGKSTLISSISAAKPKIADYPFTTLSPNLGVVEVQGETFTVADLPGLIEGASEGHGLGQRFLRHAERTAALVHLVDVLPMDGSDPRSNFEAVERELEKYSVGLYSKPRIVMLSKIDLVSGGTLSELENKFVGVPFQLYSVSSATGKGLDALLFAMLNAVKSAPSINGETVVTLRPIQQDELWDVVRKNGGFQIVGRKIERMVDMTDFDSSEAIRYLHRRLERLGLIARLREMGAEEGDTVYVGDHELAFTDEA